MTTYKARRLSNTSGLRGGLWLFKNGHNGARKFITARRSRWFHRANDTRALQKKQFYWIKGTLQKKRTALHRYLSYTVSVAHRTYRSQISVRDNCPGAGSVFISDTKAGHENWKTIIRHWQIEFDRQPKRNIRSQEFCACIWFWILE